MDDRDAAVDRCPVARVPANFDRKRERERNTMYVKKKRHLRDVMCISKRLNYYPGSNRMPFSVFCEEV